MSITLKVTPEKLRAAADTVSGQISNVESYFRQIRQEINSSRSYWEGQASDAHVQYYEGFTDEIETVLKRLKEHPKELLQMAGIYEETETEAVEVSQSLAQDVIS